jgi:FAD/FMN-containing dehydrogenase/Fe-S oxidoreductase
MTRLDPTAVPSASSADNGQAEELADLLRRDVRGVVDTSTRRRAEYSTDASNYRVVPEVVVFPRDVEDVLAVTSLSRQTGTTLTTRGAGTSVAGNSIGPGIVMDLSRHVNRVLDIDPIERTARVEPGVVLGSLQSAARPFGLRFGPDPSTWARCTIGGMIGNNACGSHSLAYGKTADNVLDLDVVDGRGRRYEASTDLAVVPGLEALVSRNLATLRTEFGRFERHVSGYSLEHLLPERGHNLAKMLVGTEGTLGVVLGATVRLVDLPTQPLLVVLGYPSMHAAADAIPSLLEHRPIAIEGIDVRLVDAVRDQRGEASVRELPAGRGWLLVEVTGDDLAHALHAANEIVAASDATASRVVSDQGQARAIWRIREDGVGFVGRTPSGKQTWPGFEDAAVPPANLGAYLREFDALLNDSGIEGVPYGHFGDGCLHVRLDMPLDRDPSSLRAFVEEAAQIVVRHGGSISGEHGDGRARSEMLKMMYSPAAIAVFAETKSLFDNRNLLNPGIIVEPAAVDANLRRPAALPLLSTSGFSFREDDGDFTNGVHRCVGIGKCRVDNTTSGGFMCPSYLATRDEKDSTRGRARVLQEMANGTLVSGWSSPEIHESLDLCLSCKACSSDCPAGVDMAMYKSEVLHRRYAGKVRPITHYVLGWLPRWARLGRHFSGLINAALQVRLLEKLILFVGGMDSRRSVPALANSGFYTSVRRAKSSNPAVKPASAPLSSRSVVLWVDSFSDSFSPDVAHAAIRVLEAAGYEVVVPPDPVCCGLTWITTGQLSSARRRLGTVLDAFGPYAAAGVPIVGLEPSCTAVLRSDLVELLPDDPRARAVKAATHTLAEILMLPSPHDSAPFPGRQLLAGTDVVVQPHCHQHAVTGFAADAALLREQGAVVTELSGCCGLAGNFGMEKGHYEVSVAVAEQSLLPALREASADTVFLADGFSCRTQAQQLAGARGLHLAELLASQLP